MLPVFARHVIWPLHERLVGRSTPRMLRRFDRTQWYAPDELADLQRRNLAALLQHAAARVPYYQDAFRAAGIDPVEVSRMFTDPGDGGSARSTNRNRTGLTPSGIASSGMDPFALLRRLPLLDKQTIRAQTSRLLWRSAPGGLRAFETGGSTGEPLQFWIDRRRQACDQAARARTRRWFGVNVGDPELWLWGSPIELDRAGRVRRLRDRLVNHHLLDAFNMSEQSMSDYLDRMNRIRPVALVGYPSSLALWARFARSRGCSLRTDRLRGVFVTGEACDDMRRRLIEDVFQTRVADGYGSRDGGFIAHQCPDGSMHIMSDSVVVEIIENGRPVPVGQTGEIVVTHLESYGMPFIRYRTGDRGRRLPGRCRCGRGLPLLDRVHGRQTDFIYLPDGSSKHALSVIYVLRQVPGLAEFRVLQHRDCRLEVEAVLQNERNEPAEHTLALLTRGLRQVMGNAVGVTVRQVHHIPTEPSGKYRQVISHVPEGLRSSGDTDQPAGIVIEQGQSPSKQVAPNAPQTDTKEVDEDAAIPN